MKTFCVSLVIFLYLCNNQLTAQTQCLDSLKTALKQASNDRERVDILNDLTLCTWFTVEHHKYQDYADQALKLAKKISYQRAIEINKINRFICEFNKNKIEEVVKKSEQANYIKGIALGYHLLGHFRGGIQEYFDKSIVIREKHGFRLQEGWLYLLKSYNYIETRELEKALPSLLTCERIAKRTYDQRLLYSVYYVFAHYYLENGEYSKSYEVLLKGKKYKPKDPKYLRGFHNYDRLLGTLYRERGQLDKALEYFANGNYNEIEPLDSAMNNIAAGETYALKGDTLKTLELIEKGLKTAKKLNRLFLILQCEANLALYGHQKNYDIIIPKLKEVIKSLESVGNQGYALGLMTKLAILYAKNQQYQDARETLQKVIQECQTHRYFKKELDAHKVMIAMNEKLGNYQQAFQNYKRYEELKEEILGAQKASEITELSLESKFQQQEQEKNLFKERHKVSQAQLKQSRTIIISSLVGVILLLIFSYILWRNNRIKRKANKLLAEQKKQITETLEKLKATQSQLVQSEKMASLGQLTAGIAHEINNPINYVYAGVDSLKINIEELKEAYFRAESFIKEEKVTELEDYKEEIEFSEVLNDLDTLIVSIKNGAERTKEIVKGLRTFSRLDEDALKDTDIHENLDSTLVLLNNQLGKRIEVIKIYGNIPHINAFPGSLNQVFMNILSNAIQAIEDKGTITIRTEVLGVESQKSAGVSGIGIQGSGINNISHPTPHTSLLIAICDTGKGMSASVLERIFEPFFTTKDVGKGTGLGLSISYSIIEKHGGKIEVTSEEGKGTEFRIILPTSHKKVTLA